MLGKIRNQKSYKIAALGIGCTVQHTCVNWMQGPNDHAERMECLGLLKLCYQIKVLFCRTIKAAIIIVVYYYLLTVNAYMYIYYTFSILLDNIHGKCSRLEIQYSL